MPKDVATESRPANKMLTPGFEEVCKAFIDDGGLTDQMQLRLLEKCYEQDEEVGDRVLNLVKVQDLMVYLCIQKDLYIGKVRPEVRLEDPAFAIRVGAEQQRCRAARAEAVAA